MFNFALFATNVVDDVDTIECFILKYIKSQIKICPKVQELLIIPNTVKNNAKWKKMLY